MMLELLFLKNLLSPLKLPKVNLFLFNQPFLEEQVDISEYGEIPLRIEVPKAPKVSKVSEGLKVSEAEEAGGVEEVEKVEVSEVPEVSKVSEVSNGWFEKYGQEYGVEPDLLVRIALCESGLNPSSTNGAYGGLYQYTPRTWMSTRTAMGLDPNPDLRFDPEEAIRTSAFKVSRGGINAWPNCSR